MYTTANNKYLRMQSIYTITPMIVGGYDHVLEINVFLDFF
jgi:hypothetical protein